MSGNGWIGVDFDGTLATYDTWIAADHTGEPIALMVDRVKRWLAEGRQVRVFTARIFPILHWDQHHGRSDAHGTHDERRLKQAVLAAQSIDSWCLRVFGHTLPQTCVKDPGMIELWDDRAVQVRPNTGVAVGTSTRGLD